MKRLVVLGGGESGVGTAILGKKEGYEVFVSDFGRIKDNYREVSVKIFNDLDKYLTRCDQLKELSSQPELSAGICQSSRLALPMARLAATAAMRMSSGMLISVGDAGVQSGPEWRCPGGMPVRRARLGSAGRQAACPVRRPIDQKS